MPIPASVLSRVIKELPDDFVMKGQSIPNYLKKRGVKEEELEYSGLLTNISEASEEYGGRIKKEDLVAMDEFRQDIHEAQVAYKGPGSSYSDLVVPGADDSSYAINVRTFAQQDEDLRQVESHFREIPDYLWHTRTTEGPVGDIDTRIVHELQSDLHQKGRQVGYDKGDKKPTSLAEANQYLENRDVVQTLGDVYDLFLDDGSFNKPRMAQILIDEWETIQQHTSLTGLSKGVPDTPFKTTWQKKALEQELLDASITGKKAIAVPLEGPGLEQLARSERVQKNYETRIRSTMKKLAKSIGGEYKEVSKGANRRLSDTDITKLQRIEDELADSAVEERWIDNDRVFAEYEAFAKELDIKVHNPNGDLIYPSELPDIFKEQVTYGQIVLPKDKEWTKKLTLYTAGGAEALIISDALKEGAPPAELKQMLINEQGLTEKDANSAVDKAIQTNIKSLLDQGAPQDELIQLLVEDHGYDEDYVQSLMPQEPGFVEKLGEEARGMLGEAAISVARSAKEVGLIDFKEPLTTEARVAKVTNIHTKYSTMPKLISGYFGSTKAKIEAKQDSQELTSHIMENLQQNNIAAEVDDYGNILIEDETGTLVPLESSLWEDLVASRAEIGYGVTAALAAERALKAARGTPGTPGTLPQRLASGALVFGGTVLAGATGATFGRARDLARNSLEAKEKIDKQLYWDQLQEAGAADVIMSVLGVTAFKLGVSTVNGIRRAVDLFTQGNKQGAYKSLKELMNLTDEQVDEIVTNWENLQGPLEVRGVKSLTGLGLSRAERALQVLPRTQPGGEAIVRDAASLNPKASMVAAQEIDTRAKDLLDQASTISSENMSTILRDEMKNYTQLVKDRFTGVKNFGIQEMADKPYAFNYSKLAIEPIFERIHSSITNPALQEQALNYMQRIRSLGGVTIETPIVKQVTKEVGDRPFKRGTPAVKTIVEDLPAVEKEILPTLRSFEDLLELRRVLNEFGSKPAFKKANAKDMQMIIDVRSRIDGEITRAAKTGMDAPEKWLNAWKNVNTEYGKMLDLRTNVLAKQIMARNKSDKIVTRQLMNSAMATDDTFRQVIEKLPPKMRALTENSVLQQFVEHYTAGIEGGMRAVNYPMLAKQLEQVPFTAVKAQDLKRGIALMADVFKNDVQLAKATGNISMPKFQSYLTTDPVVRLKYEVASQVFNFARRLMPTNRGNATALIMQAGRVLENPANVKEMKVLLNSLPKDSALHNTLKAAQIELAGFGEKSAYPHVPIYRRAAPGKTLQTTKGSLGEGIYYSTSKSGKGKLSTKQVLPGRIANEDNIAEALGVEEFSIKLLRENPQTQELLKDKGFLGLSVGDKILIFK